MRFRQRRLPPGQMSRRSYLSLPSCFLRRIGHHASHRRVDEVRVLAVARSVEIQVAHRAGGVLLGRDLPPCLPWVLLGACRQAARDSLQPVGVDVAVFVLLGVLRIRFYRFRARIASKGPAFAYAINLYLSYTRCVLQAILRRLSGISVFYPPRLLPGGCQKAP